MNTSKNRVADVCVVCVRFKPCVTPHCACFVLSSWTFCSVYASCRLWSPRRCLLMLLHQHPARPPWPPLLLLLLMLQLNHAMAILSPARHYPILTCFALHGCMLV